jgi:hypothetical protein
MSLCDLRTINHLVTVRRPPAKVKAILGQVQSPVATVASHTHDRMRLGAAVPAALASANNCHSSRYINRSRDHALRRIARPRAVAMRSLRESNFVRLTNAAFEGAVIRFSAHRHARLKFSKHRLFNRCYGALGFYKVRAAQTTSLHGRELRSVRIAAETMTGG